MTQPSSAPDPIVDAIVAVWVLDGVAAVTHRRVAEAAGISKGKLQHLYPTGGDLIAAGVDWLIRPPARYLGAGTGSDLGLYVDLHLGRIQGSPVAKPTGLDLATFEAYVWVARHAG